MADRTWNAVDARLYEEMWSREARLILGVLIARSPNQYGVYEMPYLVLSTLFRPKQIEKAIEELIAEGVIKLYRDGKVVWIVKKWKRSVPNINNQVGAYNLIQGSYPEAWSDFQGMYRLMLEGISMDGQRINHGSTGDEPSDPESESESETESDKKKKPPARKPRGHPAVSRWCELYEESFGQKFIVVPASAKHITLASKALKDDIDEFTKRVGNCFADQWFREHMPGPSYFYQHINKYATTSKKDESIIV